MTAGPLAAAVEALADRERFSGVARLDLPNEASWVLARGMADRAGAVPMRDDTVLAVASVTKGVTALTVLRLVEDGALRLGTTARSLLGEDLPLVADDVTIEQLLSHRSGIGDYLDESALGGVDEHVLTVPTHQLAACADYLVVLQGQPMREQPGTTFRYNNGGFVLLALLAERAASGDYHHLVDELVLRPAGMTTGAFLRSDGRQSGVATNYLDADGWRTNVLHMPLRGVGDGGLHCTVADLHGLWAALADGRIVRERTWHDMRQARTPPGSGPGMLERFGYGLGLWLTDGEVVFLEGYDAGISARTMLRPSDGGTCTVVANTSDGAWPIARLLLESITAPG